MGIEVAFFGVLSALSLLILVMGLFILIVWVRRLDVQVEILTEELKHLRDMVRMLTQSLISDKHDNE